jgi:transketolase
MDTTINALEMKAVDIRRSVLTLVKEGETGHTGSDLSCTDILVALYYNILNIDSKDPNDPDRDRYIQSKGHAAEVLWAILADKGFFHESELSTFSKFGSRLIGHPNNKVDGVEMNTGSLGHGLSVSVGIALAAKMDKKPYQTYTLMGDGELAEGSVWEGAMAAAHYKLDNLTAIIDRNGLQITGKSEDVMGMESLSAKFEAFGWHVIDVKDGNSMAELIEAFEASTKTGKPKLIIAHTTKGKGISFAENQPQWHHKVPSDSEFAKAMEELDVRMEVLANER